MSSNESENLEHSSSNNNDSATPEEINTFVTQLLEQMKNRFVGMGSTIISRMEDLDSRMKDLEKTVEGLMEASGTTRSSESALAAAASPATESSSRSAALPNNST